MTITVPQITYQVPSKIYKVTGALGEVTLDSVKKDIEEAKQKTIASYTGLVAKEKVSSLTNLTPPGIPTVPSVPEIPNGTKFATTYAQQIVQKFVIKKLKAKLPFYVSLPEIPGIPSPNELVENVANVVSEQKNEIENGVKTIEEQAKAKIIEAETNFANTSPLNKSLAIAGQLTGTFSTNLT